MFQFLTSFGADSNFQRQRLILTTKNFDSPDQSSLKKILLTFLGDDQQTRSQIAFATIIKKIHTSQSRTNWVYLLKNIIILDKVVEENCFLEEIASLQLKPIDLYEDMQQQGKILNAELILKTYWTFIKEKCKLLTMQNQVINNKVKFNSNTQRDQILSQIFRQNQRDKRKNSFNKTSTKLQKQKIKKQEHIKSSSQLNQELGKKINKRSILSVLRSQKQDFLKTLNKIQLMKQAHDIDYLFNLVFKFIWNIDYSTGIKFKDNIKKIERNEYNIKQANNYSVNNNWVNYSSFCAMNVLGYNIKLNSQDKRQIKEHFFNSSLAKYLHLQILYKLISLFSNQLLCIKSFINFLQYPAVSNGLSGDFGGKQDNLEVSELQILQWKRIIQVFLINSQRIIIYIQRHKNIKGFELINYQQLHPFDNINIFQMLDQYIDQKIKQDQPQHRQIHELGNIIQDSQIITVVKKLHQNNNIDKNRLIPRKIILIKRNQQLLKQSSNQFLDWENSYSKAFPQKQVLTVDLIMQLRENNNTNNQLDEQNSLCWGFKTKRNHKVFNISQNQGYGIFKSIKPLQQDQKTVQYNHNIEDYQQNGVQKYINKSKQIYILKRRDKQQQRILKNIQNGNNE